MNKYMNRTSNKEKKSFSRVKMETGQLDFNNVTKILKV